MSSWNASTAPQTPRTAPVIGVSPGKRYNFRLGRGYSSAGRALAWHARGQRFDPAYLHQTGSKDSRPEAGYSIHDHASGLLLSPSSRGLGHSPFTAITRVRISVGTPAHQNG